MFEQVIDALKLYERKLPQIRSYDARTLRDQQSQNWTSILNAISVAVGSSASNLNDSISVILIGMNHHSNTIWQFLDESPECRVTGHYPILEQTEFEFLLEFTKQNPFGMLAAITVEIGEKLRNFMPSGNNENQLMGLSHPAVLKWTTLYSAEKAIKSQLDLSKISELRASFDSLMNEISKTHGDSVEALTGFKESWQNLLEEARKELEAAKDSVLERSSLENAAITWRDKRDGHQNGFRLGLLALTVIIGLSLWYALEHGYIEFIQRFTNHGEIPYGVIVFILIPFIAIGWILKIFGKFVTSSLALASDAQLRLALLETYLRLVGDASSGVDKTDRAVMLTALFRPLPGDDKEEILPMSVADLVKSKKE
jgi:ElaB/YqjD/DUF883 family membrane-anchored ribosome-binding protein